MQAKLKHQSQFRSQRNLLFWGYLGGLFVHSLMTAASEFFWIIGFLNLLELAGFIVAFVRAKHNWLILWVYFLAASALLTVIWLAFGGFYWISGIGILGSLIWFALVPVLIYWHQQIAAQQGIDPWRPTKNKSDW